MFGRVIIIAVYFVSLALYGCWERNDRTSQSTVNETIRTESEGKSGAEIEFVSLEHDFGRVTEGEKVGWYFKFKNKGDDDLLILSATATCGCTVPDYPKAPVPPGNEGIIKVVFDTSGRTGRQRNTINIESNSNTGITQLRLIAEVIK